MLLKNTANNKTIIIIGILIAIIFLGSSVYFACTGLFTHNLTHASVQDNIRIVSDRITKELGDIDQLSKDPGDISVSDICGIYYHLRLSEGDVVLETLNNKGDVISSFNLSDDIKITNMAFDINMENGKYIVKFELTGKGKKSKKVCTISSKVSLKNLESTTTGILREIYYTKPPQSD